MAVQHPRKFAIVACSALASALLFSSMVFAQVTGPASPDVNATIKAVMDDQYGQTYDTKHACWAYSYSGGDADSDAADYCMRPGKPEIVDVGGSKILYFAASNATDIRDEPSYGYNQAQPGLVGAFKIRLGGKQGWTFVAMERAMMFGSAGDCGCRNARLEKLSNKGDYGWVFTNGGVWQGTVVANYSIVAAWKNEFIDVSKIPQIREGDQDTRYEMTVQEDPSAQGLYPLKVVKTKAKTKVAEFNVPFDAKNARYELPAKS
jgi:hypothetical protein